MFAENRDIKGCFLLLWPWFNGCIGSQRRWEDHIAQEFSWDLSAVSRRDLAGGWKISGSP